MRRDRSWGGLALALAFVLSGCPTRTIDYDAGGDGSSAGGESGRGASGSGGQGPAGRNGSTGTGGAAPGGASGTGGTAGVTGTGGAGPTGGASGGSGGVNGTGGVTGSGGTQASGGTTGAGGTTGSGGTQASGGTTGAGGTTGSGGTHASGGTTGAGGMTGTGGTHATGGTTGTGGVNGSGGTHATGGATGTGGMPATGGVSGTGGMPTCTQTGPCGTTCKPGVYTCTNGTSVCSNQTNATIGTTCGNNQVCDGSGSCVTKTADGGSCTTSQLCQNGNCAKNGSTGICCPANQVNCNGSCADLQTNANNCGSCSIVCGDSLGCSAGQCTCTTSTPNGAICHRPGQTRGTCWGGACVLPAYFSGCNSATDCVPGGCTGPGGYCLGTTDVSGEVSCTDNDGAYVVCSTQQGCLPGPEVGQVQCGDGNANTAMGLVSCDGPSDCPANNDCCTRLSGGGSFCVARTQPGVVGSGCAALDDNPNGPQSGVLCDPLNRTTTCPQGQSCASIAGSQVTFICQ